MLKLPSRPPWDLALLIATPFGVCVLIAGLSGSMPWVMWLGGGIALPGLLGILRAVVLNPFLKSSDGEVPTLAIAGLPPLSWTRDWGWECDAMLPGRSSDITVTFGCADLAARTPPTPEQIEAFEAIAERAPAVLAAVLPEFAEALSAPPEQISGLESLIRLIGVAISPAPTAEDAELIAEYEFHSDHVPDENFVVLAAGARILSVERR